MADGRKAFPQKHLETRYIYELFLNVVSNFSLISLDVYKIILSNLHKT